VTTYQAVLEDAAGTHFREFKRHRYLLILDEFHHVRRDGEFAAAIRPLAQSAAFTLGMTGTSYRHDRQPIFGIDYNADGESIKDEWIHYSIADALREEAIRDVTFQYVDGAAKWRNVDTGQIEEADELGDDNRALFVALRTEYARELLSKVIDDWLRCKGAHPWAKLLVVAATQDQARVMREYMRDRHQLRMVGIAVSDEGKTALRTIDRFRKGELDALVTVAMCYEGLDVPEITHVACLTQIRSAPWIEQMIARAWRAMPQLPWASQRARVFVPNDSPMRLIIEKIRGEMDEAIAVVRERQGELGSPDSDSEADDDLAGLVDPLSSAVTSARASTLTNGDIDQELFCRLQHTIEATGLGCTVDQLHAAIRLLERDPKLPVETRSAPDVTSREREERLRLEIEKHIRRWCAINGVHPKDVNSEIRTAGYKARKEMSESELLDLRAHVRKRWPL
jgi:superfamily II DNA or RNA helicase